MLARKNHLLPSSLNSVVGLKIQENKRTKCALSGRVTLPGMENPISSDGGIQAWYKRKVSSMDSGLWPVKGYLHREVLFVTFLRSPLFGCFVQVEHRSGESKH